MNAVSPALFALTLFVAASLLFSVQPMIARMVLPLLGGSASVWTTCMLFFQTTLLGGYAYVHVTTPSVGPPPAGGLACSGALTGVSLLADRGSRRVNLAKPVVRDGSDPGLARVARQVRGDALLRDRDDRATAPEVVHNLRTPVGPRPVFPLCREQRRKPRGPGRLSIMDRAQADSRRTDDGLVGRLCRVGGNARGMCRLERHPEPIPGACRECSA